MSPVKTSTKLDNYGRRFIGCGMYEELGRHRCEFFEWVDPPNCRSCKNVVPELLSKMKECENEILCAKTNEATVELEMVKCREVVKLYEAKINLCNEEISKLKVAVEKYKKK